MAVTRSQIFKFGNLVLAAFTGGAGTVMLTSWHLPADQVASITAAIGFVAFMWNGAAAIFDNEQTQIAQAANSNNPVVQKTIAQAAAANIENPVVKPLLVQTVSHLEGVTSVGINDKASPELKALADSTAAVNSKIEKAA